MTASSAVQSTPPVQAPAFTVEILNAFDDATLGAETWDRHVEAVGGSLYTTYDWCRIWWTHYGARRRLRVYIFREGDRIVGLAPMFIETVWLGPIRLKLAKRVGADSALTVFALPLSPGSARAAYRILIADLLDSLRCDALWLGPVPSDDPTLETLRELCETLRSEVRVVRDAAAGVQSVFRLPGDFADYLARLEKPQRQNFGRQQRLLEKDFTCVREIVTDGLDAQCHFRAFVPMHERQWTMEGKLGHFGDWPGSCAFNRDLVQCLGASGRVRMHRLVANGSPIAVQYAFVFADVCYWRLTARLPEPRYSRFGLGVLGLVHMIEAMIGEGVRRIEGGVGHYAYKLRFGAEEVAFRSVLIVPARRASVLRARLFLLASDLLHVVYYRAWFLRIAPRLGLPRHPLWPLWIRSRL